MTCLPPEHTSGWLTQVSRKAMATEFVVMLAAEPASSVEAAVEALELVDAIEARLTIYRPDSEISRVNREAASKPVQVSESTFAVFEKAVQWSQRTGGLFDITAGPLVQAWGFTERRGRQPSRRELDAALAVVGHEKLLLNASQRTIAFAVPGMSINLGGIGKGFALDQVAERLVERGIGNFLIHGGQSSVLARGDQIPDPAAADGVPRGWAVGIEHPTRPDRRLAGFWLRDAALGTSGSGKQFFHHRGQRLGHVIDPRSGAATTDLVSLTAIATTATDADAAATGLFLVGSERLRTLVAERPTSLAEPTSLQSDEFADSRDVGLAAWPLLWVQMTSREHECIATASGEWDWIDPPAMAPSSRDDSGQRH